MNKNGYFKSDKDGKVTVADPPSVAPPFSGGAPSWNDLTDKPFGESVVETELIGGEAYFSYDSTNNYSNTQNFSQTFGNFVVGQEYIVEWDGVKYTGLVCFAEGSTYCIGASTRNTMTEEMPFHIYTYHSKYICFYGYGDAEYHTVWVSVPTVEVATLDEKYIPDTIMRVEDANLLTSPNGTQYKITVADDGTLSATAI